MAKHYGNNQKGRELQSRVPSVDKDHINIDRQSESTSVWNLVLFVLLISLIASVFMAYSNSTGDGESFQYFSPVNMFRSLQTDTYVSPGIYELRYQPSDNSVMGGNTPFTARYEAYVWVDGRKIVSVNTDAFASDLRSHSYQFEFVVGGVSYTSYTPNLEELEEIREELGAVELFEVGNILRVVRFSSGTVTTFELPDGNTVKSAWSSIDGKDFLTDFANAVDATIDYVFDFFKYQMQLIDAFLPWNYVETGNCDYLPSIWKDAEQRSGL